jgi:hypothetical protein
MNLILATGLACSIVGALLVLVSHYLIRSATGMAVAYARELGRRRVHREDRRFGLRMLACGGVLLALAVFGFTAPVSLWRYPVYTAIGVILLYCMWRVAASRRKGPRRRQDASQKSINRSIYDTPRSFRLRQAAQSESAGLHAMEAARNPRDAGVVYLAREWDRRWWSDRFGVSTDVLKAAIRQVGPMSKDVERHLSVQGRAGLAV